MPKTQPKPRAPGTEQKKKKDWPDFTKKFGPRVRKAGVTAVPTVLLDNLAELKLKSIHCVILLQMIACWGNKGPHPFPRRSRMLKSIGCDKRTLDRAIAEMVDAGLIKKNARFQSKRQTSNEYDLSGLIERLRMLAVVALKRKKRLAAARAAAIE